MSGRRVTPAQQRAGDPRSARASTAPIRTPRWEAVWAARWLGAPRRAFLSGAMAFALCVTTSACTAQGASSTPASTSTPGDEASTDIAAEVQRIIDENAPPPGFELTVLVVRTSDGEVVVDASSRREFASGPDALHRSGSTLKPVLLFAAGRSGAIPTDGLIAGVNCVFPDGSVSNPDGVSEPAVSLITAAAESSDCGFRKLTRIVGRDSLEQTLDVLGLTREFDTGETFAVGANYVSSAELVTMYRSLLLGRTVGAPADASGDETRSIDATTAAAAWDSTNLFARDVTIDSLSEVLTTGTAAGSDIPGHPAIGKTGTSQDSTSVWFAGGTPEYVAAVWAGDPTDSGRPLPPMALSDGEAPHGGTYSARIWSAILTELLANEPAQPLPTGSYTRDPVVLVDVDVDCVSKDGQPAVTTDDVALPHLPAGTVGLVCRPEVDAQ